MKHMTNAGRTNLGFLEAGSRVAVDISGAARVRLMEPEAMVLLQAGLPSLSPGGVYGPGTVTLTVPEDGYWWHLVGIEGMTGAVTLSRVRTRRLRWPIRRLNRWL